MKRNLASILVADIAGYTRLMETHEVGTHARLMALRTEVIEPGIAAQDGRIVKNTGDGFIAIFDSVSGAVRCAVDIQKAVQLSEAAQPAELRIAFRMGLNVGDVVVEQADVYGVAVNIAARLQDLAEPGAVMMSAAVYQQAGAELSVQAVDLGETVLKNIAQPVRIFRAVVSTHAGRARASRTQKGGVPSIAVLPFRMVGQDEAQSYFGEGIVEDIIGALAALKELVVISRNSTLAYKSSHVDFRKVSQELNVRYVVSGSVRRDARRVRIMAELTDTYTGVILWAQPYDFDGDDLFVVQDKITAQIVSTVAPRVRAAEIRRALLKRPDSMDAYDHVLQALDLMYHLEPADFARAGTLLQRAIALDDSYATAYALSAQWHMLRSAQGWSDDPHADWREALRLSEAAVIRDDFSAQALAQLGHHKSYILRDYDTALSLFERATNASPNNSWAWGLSAPTFSYLGDGDAAIARAERAIRLSPHDPLLFWYQTSLCVGHFTRGAYEEAAHWGKIAARANARYTAVLLPTAAALAALGRPDEASEFARKVIEVTPGFRVGAHVERYPYRDHAHRERLREHLLLAGLPP